MPNSPSLRSSWQSNGDARERASSIIPIAGSQYAASEYRDILQAAAITQIDEPQGELLGKCAKGEFLRHSKN